MSKGKNIALWVLSILLAALFIFSASPKLLTPDKVGPMFVHYGYAAWFATFIGCCEVLGAIGLLVPRVAGLAAACLSIIMVGAAYTHFSHQEYGHGCIPVVLFVLLVWISYTRFHERRT